MQCAVVKNVYVALVLGGPKSLVPVVVPSVTAPPCLASELVLLAPSEWVAVTSQLSAPYDYVMGAGFWGFGFAGVMILYFTAHVIGLVLKGVKNW